MKKLITILLLNAALVVIGIILADRYANMNFIAAAVSLMAIITFFGVLIQDEVEEKEALLRNAIAISVVSVYLVLVGIITFYSDDVRSNEFTKTLLSSFTSLAGVVVAFYFGASAYVEIKRAEKNQAGGGS